MRAKLLISLIPVLGVQLVLAQIPQTISYQGVLTDAAGNPVADDTYNLRFGLYDGSNPSVATLVWTEDHTAFTTVAVDVAEGIFTVLLGEFTTFSSVPLAFDRPYWLQIDVYDGAWNDPATLPVIPLTAAPYAINASAVTGTGNVFPSSGNVGIGTVNPSAKLDVAGDANVQGDLSVTGTITQGSQTEYYSFGVRDANALLGDQNYLKAYVMAGGGMYYPINTTIPIHLPQGATITDITIHVDDNNSANDAECALYVLAGNSFTQLESALTPWVWFSSTGIGTQSPTITLPTPHTVDNQTNIYWLRIYAGAGIIEGPTILFYGGYITYTVN